MCLIINCIVSYFALCAMCSMLFLHDYASLYLKLKDLDYLMVFALRHYNVILSCFMSKCGVFCGYFDV